MSIERGGSMEFQKRAFALWRTVPTIAGFLFAFVAAVSAKSRINLAGSGSNVAGPLFVAWTDEFNKKNPAIVQIPVLLVAVVPVYNVPGGGELRFSGKVLAQIYLGAIKNWNDPAISRLNPDVALPDLPIEVFSPRRRQRYELYLHGFSLPEESGVPLASRKKRIAQVAGRHDGEAECRYGRESESHARRHRVRGAELRHTGISGFR